MAKVRIEMDRGNGWEVRVEADANLTAEQVAAQLPSYAVQHPHRAFVDGVLVAEQAPQIKRRKR